MTRAIGTAERTRRSAASMALATCSPVAVAFTAILAATSNSSGPRCSVLIWMIDSTPSPASAFWIARWCARLALSPMSSDFISTARMLAMRTSRMPIIAVPAASQRPSPVSSVIETPNSANIRPRSAPQSSNRMTGNSGALAVRTNSFQGAVRAYPVRLDDGRPQRVGLHGHGHQEDHDGDPLPGVDRVRVRPLVPRLVQGEEAADAEQHDRHDEGVNVALTSVAERMLGCRRALGSFAAEQQGRLVAGVGQRMHRLREHR